MGDSNPRTSSSSCCSLRCPHCAGPLSKATETSHWTVAPLIRDSFSMIGSAVGGTASAFYGCNHVMPVVQRRVKGPIWLHFLIGAPPVIVFSSACAGLAGGAIPALAQLASSSYHAAVTSPSLPAPPQDEKLSKSTTSSTLLQKDSKDRLSANELMRHPFLTVFDDLGIDLASYFTEAGSPLATL